MEKLAKFTMIIIFIIALLLHMMSYFRPVSIAWSVMLFVLILPWWAAMVWRIRDKSKNVYEDFSWLSDPIALIPIVIFLYVWLSSMYGMSNLQKGSGVAIEGHYYLENKSRIVEEISYEKYRQLVLTESRLFTGMPLAFAGFLLGDLRIRSLKTKEKDESVSD